MIIYPLNIFNKLQEDIDAVQTVIVLEDANPYPSVNG